MTKWFNKHVADAFVKRSQAEGYRARSVYKLEEICTTLKPFKTPHTIVLLPLISA